MKSFSNFLIIIFLFISLHSCYNINEYEPPVVQIILPESETKLIDSLEVICLASDDGEIDYIEMWIDGDSEETDDNVPYSFMLYSEDFEDKSKHVITARAYDDEGYYTDSEPVYFDVFYPEIDTSKVDTTDAHTFEKGHFIYLASSNDDIYRYNLNNSSMELLLSEYRGTYLHYMKDINKIGYRSHGSYHISTMELDGSDQKIIYDLPTMTCIHDYCSNNSTFYGYNIGNPNRIVSINPEKNEFKYLTDPLDSEDYNGSINEEGNLLLFNRNKNNHNKLYLLDLGNDNIQDLQFQNINNRFWAKWSKLNNGFFFIEEVANEEYILKYYDFETKSEEIIYSNNYRFGYSFSPDEKFIALTINKDNIQNLYIYDRENEYLEQKTFLDFRLFHEQWVEIK